MGRRTAEFPLSRPPSLPESIASRDGSRPMCKGRLTLCVWNRKVGRRDKVSNALVYAQGEIGAMRTLGEAEVGLTDASLPRRRRDHTEPYHCRLDFTRKSAGCASYPGHESCAISMKLAAPDRDETAGRRFWGLSCRPFRRNGGQAPRSMAMTPDPPAPPEPPTRVLAPRRRQKMLLIRVRSNIRNMRCGRHPPRRTHD